MSSNAVSIHHNAALLSVVEVTAPVETSDMIDDRLATVFKRLRLPKRLLQRVAGVRVRRMWRNHKIILTALHKPA